MAEAAANPRGRVVQQEGLLSNSLTAVAKIIQWLLLSLVFSILIEWAGMVLWWPDEGLEHSRTMLAREVGYLDFDFRRSVVTSDPVSPERATLAPKGNTMSPKTSAVPVLEALI